MTSGSPPVFSISLSDHSFSAFASSFDWTLAHSRPLWRFMCFSKRAFNTLSSSSLRFGDNSFLLLVILFILLLRAHRPTWATHLNFTSFGRNSFANVVLPAPLHPA